MDAPSKATIHKVGGGASSNWQALKAILATSKDSSKPAVWRKRKAAAEVPAAADAAKTPGSVGTHLGITQVIALDCEMVGVGPGGDRSALARVCVVNSDGNVLLDTFVKPKERVTDFRTRFSGVRASDLKDASAFEDVQLRVAELLAGRILVGHALKNDLEVLMLSHPRKDIRDTARYTPLMRPPRPGRKPKPKALRVLAREELGLTIQAGEHSPADDARCALYLYQKHRKAWEAEIAAGAATRRANGLAPKAAKLQPARGSKAADVGIEASLPAMLGGVAEGKSKGSSKGEARRRRLGHGEGAAVAAAPVRARTWQYPIDVRQDPFADL